LNFYFLTVLSGITIPENVGGLEQSQASPSFISVKRNERKTLKELRKHNPNELEFDGKLQLIRLELKEMREQDKSIFLQLAKVHSDLKDLKAELNQNKNKKGDEDFLYSVEDFYQLPSWWNSHNGVQEEKFFKNEAKHLNYQHSNKKTGITNFSSSDGAQFVRTLSVQSNRRRRGRSPLPLPLATNPLVYKI